ncbi:MAG: deoxyuridine 5'-triphosphate nucleotidohydrolase [Bacilli bacterium]|jgi:dUTP pyrophosphatase|nr:deoxyuridine 5'-triphosphate nucleotidohydrolase [Clostridium sp.]MDY3798734.1 deoxyuridine 5'-triphosphate nucleotidohydrolase [Bacilli bacterium]CDE95360.1 deoxyuridine 5'triphosphate nucleotidohydrolase dUTPase [Clostridium sp. CAG:914]
MRSFEKISFEQFKNDVCDDKLIYNKFKLPNRSTKNSAGYDFFSLFDFSLKPGEIMKIPTGIKVNMENNDVLFLVVRSSMGFKYNVRMCNQVGVIDSDYYNNSDNEGHIWIKLKNEGDKDFIVKNGDAICQGIFLNYLTVTNERDVKKIRNGGLGSTNGGKDER